MKISFGQLRYRHGGCRLVLLASLLISFKTVAYNDGLADLMLVGGALKTCSSMAAKNCEESEKLAQGKTELLYQFDKAAHQRWQKTQVYDSLNTDFRSLIDAVLLNNYSSGARLGLSKNDFLDRLDDGAGDKKFVSQLADSVYYSLLDTHEQFQAEPNGKRLQERVDVNASRSQASIEILSTFVAQVKTRAGDAPAKIAVVTASSRDPFEAADFYTGMFEQLNVEVVWLPLSAALQQAWSLQPLTGKGCDYLVGLHEKMDLYDRQRVYPDLAKQERHACIHPEWVREQLNSSQGVFFNGGDQSKTLAALLNPNGEPSEVLQLIANRVTQKQLIVGGTSAGTAVQAGGQFNQRPIPMFSNGDPETVMSRGVFAVDAPSQRGTEQALGLRPSDTTIRGQGGTGLFHFGLLDTHFSERDRETRLIAATLASQQRFGFGVDETTALMVSRDDTGARFSVIGNAGVFVIDMHDSQFQQSQSGERFERSVAGLAHYWPAGTHAELSGDNLTVVLGEDKSNSQQRLASKLPGQWRSQTDSLCRAAKGLKWQHFDSTAMVKPSQESAFVRSSKGWCGYSALPFVITTAGQE